ncbi:putative RNA methyltransferase [Saccharococcus caldoxylosilyticus]|uniref:Ribosomal RNA large subunit methyltransferase A n=1 Tax=Saccharococcus caldoxylosilyticus TaxID=81408 RepID=A0A150KWN2_9BACL|nr:methyltransferase domain-containing protein [Parageobacillus caldoxylosilyticus]KYD04450.1 Ribosomal RNA large subunit methyltransferase A [Parageobacillus caldoxylosilyticus]
MSKKIICAKLINKFEKIFQCPICSSPMGIVDLKSLVCSNNHTFDIAKQGYVNLMTRPLATKYDKELFESRKIIAENGFFEPLHKMISEWIKNEVRLEGETVKILDTGCGEGSHLSSIKQKISFPSAGEVLGVGIDIAKEGILVAAKNHYNMIWCVADLAHSPFKDNTFDVILNILSPANYREFQRLLNGNGIVIKVIPRSDYLKELREVFFDEPEKQSYSNQKTVRRFNANFEAVDKFRLCYSVSLNQSLIPPLIRMTPLSWSATAEKVQALLNMNVGEITIDLDILVGKNKTK